MEEKNLDENGLVPLENNKASGGSQWRRYLKVFAVKPVTIFYGMSFVVTNSVDTQLWLDRQGVSVTLQNMTPNCKVATDTYILDLRTRYRIKLGFFGSDRYKDMGKWQILYLRTRYRSKWGWFFWFGPIHVTIRRNLAKL